MCFAGECHCRRWRVPAVLGVFLAMGAPARADVTDVMREVQRSVRPG